MPSPPSKKIETPLARAAAALEAELLEYEKFVAEVKRMNLNSEKSMHRAKDLLEQCAAGEQRMAERLQAFAAANAWSRSAIRCSPAAMQGVQVRQQACISDAVAAASLIQERVQKRSALLERFSALGDRARSLNEPVAQLEAKEGDANAQDLLTTLGEVAARTESVVAEAEALGADAAADDWQDIAREATALRQQLLSARNKILVAQRDVAARTPS